jgi:hypothetical protein
MTSAEESAVTKFAVRLVPFLGLMFFINYLDRTAISFAGPNGMTRTSACQPPNSDFPRAFFSLAT